jgi:hypothetical protein
MSEVTKKIRVTLAEERPQDAWFDFSLRQLRDGAVRYYRVTDFLTGDWLFKICIDPETGKVIVKAVKCPSGRLYAQFEGDTMLFQRGAKEGALYDVISLSYTDEEGRIRRRVAQTMEDVSEIIRANFTVCGYEEGVGKPPPPGRGVVTLTKDGDFKEMIILFLLERVWPLAPITPEVAWKADDVLSVIRELEYARVDEVYPRLKEKLGIGEEEFQKILQTLEAEKRIVRPEEGHVKTVSRVS